MNAVITGCLGNTLFFLTALCIFCVTLFAPDYALGIEKGRMGTLLGPAEAADALERLSGVQAGMSSMTASTVQTKTSPLLEGVVRTEGRIWIKRPALLRWEIERPDRLIIVADAEAMIIYRPKARVATRRLLANDISARYTMEFFSSGMTLSMAELSKRFSVSVFSHNTSTVVELRPKSKFAGKFLKKAVISYGSDGIPEWFEVETANGGTTRTELGLVAVNSEIPPAAFKLQLPSDVVVRQLGDDEVR